MISTACLKLKTIGSIPYKCHAPLPPSIHPDTDDNDNEINEDDDEEDAGDYYVRINGTQIHYNSITPEMVGMMSQEEMEEYVRVGREMHEMFD